MRIAICDDELFHREALKTALTGCVHLPEDASITEYPGGRALINDHKKNPFNIIFLDIEMEDMSGLEAGQEIRRLDRNVRAALYGLEGHEVYLYYIPLYASDGVTVIGEFGISISNSNETSLDLD